MSESDNLSLALRGEHRDDSNEKVLQKVSRLGNIALTAVRTESQLASVKRIPRLPNGEREDDVQYSFSLAILAPELRAQLYPDLDNDKIQSFSNAHELLEIATGDAATFNLTEEQLREKHRREQ